MGHAASVVELDVTAAAREFALLVPASDTALADGTPAIKHIVMDIIIESSGE